MNNTCSIPVDPAVEFAHRLSSRILGNDPDQRVLPDTPSQLIDFGIIFSRLAAIKSRSLTDNRSRFRPNSLAVRFEVHRDTLATLQLAITPSFWLWVARRKNEPVPWLYGDLLEDTIWTPWDQRPVKGPVAVTDISQMFVPQAEDTQRRPFVRVRYCQGFRGTLGQFESTVSLDDDLARYRQQIKWLANDSRLALPNWTGRLEAERRPGTTADRAMLEIRLVNELNDLDRGRETGWFDVRLRVRVNCPILPTECSLLDGQTVEAQTINCVVDRSNTVILGEDSHDDNLPDLQQGHSQVAVEQVGMVIRHRRVMRECSSYADVAQNIEHLFQDVEAVAAQARSRAPISAETAAHATLLNEALTHVRRNDAARRALSIVAKTFHLVWPARHWYLYQETMLILGANAYLTGQHAITPLVVNVPTAGGKTEAFLAIGLWSAVFEALTSRRRGIALVKYPTLMLSTEQARRMAQLVMAFDLIMDQEVSGYQPRGVGFFFGRDKDFNDKPIKPNPRKHIGNQCLLDNCQKPWVSESAYANGTGREFICSAGHILRVATNDEVFLARPTLIASTTHKLVAKASNSNLRLLLGAEPYYCQHEAHLTVMPQCSKKSDKHELRTLIQHPEDISVITTVVLDEAHLIREGTGALASHFETHYLEIMKELSGRYPSYIVSTATIAHVDNHSFHLGFVSKPIVFPGREGENEDLYYAGTDEPQHVMLACVPRGRALAWAMPHLITDYFEVLEQGRMQGLDFSPFRPTMGYFSSYATQDQVQDGLNRRINDLLVDNPAQRRLQIEEFSRRRFILEGMENVIRRVDSGDVDVIFSTNVASVGIDIEKLRSIVFFGVPSNVSEFVQSVNRVARRPGQAGLAILLHNPYFERDNSYYAYLYPFTQKAHRIVEAIPLNRFARQAIRETFDTLMEAELKHLWAPRLADKTRAIGKPLWILNVDDFPQAVSRGLLPKDQVLDFLDRVYRSDADPSGAYKDLVRNLWTNFVNQVRGAQHATATAKAKLRDIGLHLIWSLIPQEETGHITFTGEAEALRAAHARALFSYERNEEGVSSKIEDPEDSHEEALTTDLDGHND